MEFVQQEDEMEFIKEEDEILMETVYEMESKGLYIGSDFWDRINLKMGHKGVTRRSACAWMKRCGYLYSLGPDMKSLEERYYDLCGRYYEDDYVPTLEEEIENGDEEELQSSSDYDD